MGSLSAKDSHRLCSGKADWAKGKLRVKTLIIIHNAVQG
jgi:hypothetical protein